MRTTLLCNSSENLFSIIQFLETVHIVASIRALSHFNLPVVVDLKN